MRFTYCDLRNKPISSSYSDLVQRYDSGSVQYFLDGAGYSIFSFPSGSIGQSIITSGQTASYAFKSSTSLVADVALIADTASIASLADFSISSSWATQSLSASYASTCSISFFSFTNITQSFIASASWASSSLSSSYLSASTAVIGTAYMLGKLSGIRITTGSITLSSTDYTILCDGAFTIFLPTASMNDGRLYNIKKLGNSGSIMISGSEKIDDQTSVTLTSPYSAYALQCGNNQWYIL